MGGGSGYLVPVSLHGESRPPATIWVSPLAPHSPPPKCPSDLSSPWGLETETRDGDPAHPHFLSLGAKLLS